MGTVCKITDDIDAIVFMNYFVPLIDHDAIVMLGRVELNSKRSFVVFEHEVAAKMRICYKKYVTHPFSFLLDILLGRVHIEFFSVGCYDDRSVFVGPIYSGRFFSQAL